MIISAVNDAGELFSVKVNDKNILSLKQALASLCGIHASDQLLLWNGQELVSLENVTENDIVLVRQKQTGAAQYPGTATGTRDAMLDVEAQKRIEDEIKRYNIAENLSNAMEYNPESFGRVVMLYIPIKVNGVSIKAFVDSGAQATIIAPSLATKCGIMHLLDERFSGIARGVGTAKILGRIHSAPIKVGNLFLPCSFTVMENKGVEFLLGLDMLRRHQAIIDLQNNILKIGDDKVEFLPEHEIPSSALFDEPAENSQPTSSSTPASIQLPQPSHNRESYSEKNIQSLMGFGISRQEAIQALDACNGNVDIAASMLFN